MQVLAWCDVDWRGLSWCEIDWRGLSRYDIDWRGLSWSCVTWREMWWVVARNSKSLSVMTVCQQNLVTTIEAHCNHLPALPRQIAAHAKRRAFLSCQEKTDVTNAAVVELK